MALPKFSQGQSAPVDRQGTAEFKSKKRKKPKQASVKSKAPTVPMGGFTVGMPT